MFLNTTGNPTSPPDLALSNSLSTVSVQYGFTPSGEKIITLDSIFLAAGLSPPTKSDEQPLNHIICKANEILNSAGREEWTKLNVHEQVQLAFLIWKEQHTLILRRNGNDEVAMANTMLDALKPGSDQNKALEPFLRLGGDEHGSDDNCFNEFLVKHPEWRDDEKAVCIFTSPTPFRHQMLPFIRCQKIISMVCFLVSAANAIFYYMIWTTGTGREQAIVQYGLNIGRFLRNNIANDQMFELIFCGNGGYPVQVLESLLEHTNTKGQRTPKTFSFPLEIMYNYDNADLVQKIVATHLSQLGPLLVCDFRMFPKYTDTSITTFHGSWESWKDPDATEDAYHAFLITGVRKTPDGSMGGVVFQVQDSLPGRPFVNIGLDLIRSMGVRDVVRIKQGVVFQGTSFENCFDIDKIPFSLSSGSPRGVPLEVTTTGMRDFSLHRLRSDDLGDSAVADTDTATGANNRSQKEIPDLPLGFDLPPGTDTTNLVIYT